MKPVVSNATVVVSRESHGSGNDSVLLETRERSHTGILENPEVGGI